MPIAIPSERVEVCIYKRVFSLVLEKSRSSASLRNYRNTYQYSASLPDREAATQKGCDWPLELLVCGRTKRRAFSFYIDGQVLYLHRNVYKKHL